MDIDGVVYVKTQVDLALELQPKRHIFYANILWHFEQEGKWLKLIARSLMFAYPCFHALKQSKSQLSFQFLAQNCVCVWPSKRFKSFSLKRVSLVFWRIYFKSRQSCQKESCTVNSFTPKKGKNFSEKTVLTGWSEFLAVYQKQESRLYVYNMVEARIF